jgi:hypothetical protein
MPYALRQVRREMVVVMMRRMVGIGGGWGGVQFLLDWPLPPLHSMQQERIANVQQEGMSVAHAPTKLEPHNLNRVSASLSGRNLTTYQVKCKLCNRSYNLNNCLDVADV